MFIVIEGIDGSGKSTQIALLKSLLEANGKTVKLFDFPRYNKPSSYFVTKFLNGEYERNLSPKLISLFFALDRFDALADLLTSIDDYDFVLSNRYVTSNMVHQVAKMLESDKKHSLPQKIDEFLDWLEETEYSICGIPRPDVVLFLDVPPEISFRLIEQKQQRHYIKDGNKDINEASKTHQFKAYDAAQYLIDRYCWEKVVCFEQGKLLSPKEISGKIYKNIECRM